MEQFDTDKFVKKFMKKFKNKVIALLSLFAFGFFTVCMLIVLIATDVTHDILTMSTFLLDLYILLAAGAVISLVIFIIESIGNKRK